MNMNRYYTGIGSRQTPKEIIVQMIDLASKLANLGYILRSGGAMGADSAFETGCDSVYGNKEIYLPWKNFNNNKSNFYGIPEEAFEITRTIHPAWQNLTRGGRNLHARNIMQILGNDLKTPSKFVICWTKNGQLIGGTRTALVLANQYNIPIYNLYHSQDYERLIKWILVN